MILSSARINEKNRLNIKMEDVRFTAIQFLLGIFLFISLIQVSAVYLCILIFPLVLYDRAFMYVLFMALSLCQGSFVETSISAAGAQDAGSFAESLSLLLVAPLLAYDLFTQKSKKIPDRFLIWYLLFYTIVIAGAFVYYQYPQNFTGLASPSHSVPALKGIMKSIKILFYIFYLKVLINYAVSTNTRTLEYARLCMPYIIIVITLFLFVGGTAHKGAGTEVVQAGDTHHGTFTSQLCSMCIYPFFTLYRRNETMLRRIIALIAIIACAITVLLMGSRNGLVCFCLVSAIGTFVNIRDRRLDFQFLIYFGTALAVFVGGILSLQTPTVQRAIYMTEVESGGDRTYYWEAGAIAIQEHPIFGWGGDESASIAAVQRHSPAMIDSKIMHNTYLEMAVEYGLIAALFYILLMAYVLLWAFRLYQFGRRKGYVDISSVGISYFILMFAALFVSDIWDTAIWYNQSLVFALAIQLLYAQYSNKRRINTRLTFKQAAGLS